MTNQPFSLREGFRNGTNLVYDDAPDAIRIGIREVLHVLGYQRPTAQRQILCSALRITPDQNNWSDYPNVDFEVSQLIQTGPWYKFFDALERIPKLKPRWDVHSRGDENWLGCASEALSSVLGEWSGTTV